MSNQIDINMDNQTTIINGVTVIQGNPENNTTIGNVTTANVTTANVTTANVTLGTVIPINSIGNITTGPIGSSDNDNFGNVSPNGPNQSIQSNVSDGIVENSDELLELFHNAVNNENLEEAINLATFFPYDHEGILRAVIQKKNTEWIELFVGLGYVIPTYIFNYTVVHYLLMSNMNAVPFIVDNMKYEQAFTLEGRNVNLLKACKEPNISLNIVETLMKYSYYLDYTDEAGNTYLIWAAARGNFEVVKKFIELNIDTRKKTTEHYSAIDYAFIGKHFEICDYLLDKGCEMNLEKIIQHHSDGAYEEEYLIKIIDKQGVTEDLITIIFNGDNKNFQKYIITKYPNDIIFKIINSVHRDEFLKNLADQGYDFNTVNENGDNIIGYIFSSNYQLNEQFNSILPYLDKIDVNHKNKQGNSPLFNLKNDFNEILEKCNTIPQFDFFIKNTKEMTFLDELLIDNYTEIVIEILSEKNIKLIEYLHKVNTPTIIAILKNNHEIFDLVLCDTLFDMRKYLDKNINDLNIILELGLLKRQFNKEDIQKYSENINYKTLVQKSTLLSIVFELDINISDKIKLFEFILFRKATLLDLINYKSIIEEYYNYTGKTILTYLANECSNEQGTLLIIKHIFSKEVLIEQNKKQNVFDKFIVKNKPVIINYLIENDCDLSDEQRKVIIEELDVKFFSEITLKKIFTNITDNTVLLKLLLTNSKYEKLILDTATQKEQTDNCIICYGKEADRPYYYQCEHNHNYHFDCLIPYLKKHKMTNMICFYCKGDVCFNNIFKN
jgi:ankyrin repeat protein